MKFGIRKPSLKKSIKARTTGKIKRKMKKAVNPLYGKKGMGWIKNPKKAMYNKVYHKTTVGVTDLIPKTSKKTSKVQKTNKNAIIKTKSHTNTSIVENNIQIAPDKPEAVKITSKKPIIPSPKSKTVASILCIFGGYIGLHRFYVGKIGTGIFYMLTGGICGLGWLFDLLCLWVDQFEDKEERTLLSKAKQEAILLDSANVINDTQIGSN